MVSSLVDFELSRVSTPSLLLGLDPHLAHTQPSRPVPSQVRLGSKMCTLDHCFVPYPLLMPSFQLLQFTTNIPTLQVLSAGSSVLSVLTGQHLATSLPCSHTDETLVSSVLAFHLFQSCSSHCPGFSLCMVLVLPDPRGVPFLFQHPSAFEVGKRPHSS